MGSQALASATNLALNIQLARNLPPVQFGGFSVYYALLLLIVVGARALMAEPYVMRVAGDCAGRSDGKLERQTVGMTVTIGLGCAFAIAVIGGLTAPAGLSGRIVVGFAAVVIAHDVARGMLLGQLRAAAAFATDALWAAVQVAALLVGFAVGMDSSAVAIVAWAAGATAALALACVFLRVLPAPSMAFRASGHPFRRGVPWAIDYLAAAGAVSLLVVVLGVLIDLEQVAALRGALVLVGPSTVLIGGIRNLALPRLARTPLADVMSASRRLGWTMAMVVAAATAPLLLVGPKVGRALLGESWGPARAVLPLLILQRCGTAAANGSSIGLRVLGSTSATAVVRVLLTAASVGAGVIGAMIGGAVGAVALMIPVTVLAIPVWDRLLAATLGPVVAAEALRDQRDDRQAWDAGAQT